MVFVSEDIGETRELLGALHTQCMFEHLDISLGIYSTTQITPPV